MSCFLNGIATALQARVLNGSVSSDFHQQCIVLQQCDGQPTAVPALHGYDECQWVVPTWWTCAEIVVLGLPSLRSTYLLSLRYTIAPQDNTMAIGDKTAVNAASQDLAQRPATSSEKAEFLATFTEDENKAIMRKVDRRFLLLIGVLYMTKNLDYQNAAIVKVSLAHPLYTMR